MMLLLDCLDEFQWVVKMACLQCTEMVKFVTQIDGQGSHAPALKSQNLVMKVMNMSEMCDTD